MKINPKAAESLANPDEYPNLFPGWEQALEKERSLGGGSPNAVADLVGEGLADLSLTDSAMGSTYGKRDNDVYEEEQVDTFEDANEEDVMAEEPADNPIPSFDDSLAQEQEEEDVFEEEEDLADEEQEEEEEEMLLGE